MAPQPRAIKQIFPSFLVFYCYFTRLKVREINIKHEELGKYLSFRVRYRVITNTYILIKYKALKSREFSYAQSQITTKKCSTALGNSRNKMKPSKHLLI